MWMRRAAIVVLPVLFGGCKDWITDFTQQPSVGTWQSFSAADSADLKEFRGQPVNSVGTHGTFAAGYQISYAKLPATIDSFAAIPNPVAPDARSLLNGRKYFSINCAVCHGAAGDGNGYLKQLSPTFAFAPSLTADVSKARTDGYIWGMMRNGRGLMPSLNRLEEVGRWDVLDFVRGLPGKYPVDTGAVGRPGETGATLPGHTRLGPQVPAKYFHPVVSVRERKEEGAHEVTEPKKPEEHK